MVPRNKKYIDDEDLSLVIQDPTRVFNADESGFNICPKTNKVLAEKGSKNLYEIEKSSAKENLTVLFTFSATGQVCNPFIYPYKRIPDRVTLTVPSGWGIGRSDSGWMTAAVFYDYTYSSDCFHQELTQNNIPFPVILFVDGHKTHITLEVSELCRSLQIHLIALYPNATRILQPADVAAFRPIKAGWKKMLREWYIACNYQETLNKESFAPLLKKVVDSSTKKETLINPFEPDNLDYSKCLSTKKPENDAPTAIMNTTDAEYLLTYSDFCEIVGESIILPM